MSDLKPCPFCGGEAKVERSLRSFTPELWETYAYAKCKKCGARVEGADEAEAIEAWNARYERTCHKELMIWFYPETELTSQREVEYFGCSKCGEWLSDTDCYGLDDGPFYCSNCGCKVDPSFVTDEVTGEVIYRDGARVKEDTNADGKAPLSS